MSSARDPHRWAPEVYYAVIVSFVSAVLRITDYIQYTSVFPLLLLCLWPYATEYTTKQCTKDSLSAGCLRISTKLTF